MSPEHSYAGEIGALASDISCSLIDFSSALFFLLRTMIERLVASRKQYLIEINSR